MATITWVILKHHKKTDGTFNPKIRVTHNRTISYMATNIYTPFVRFRRGSSTGVLTSAEVEDCLNERVSAIRKILNTHQEFIDRCENAKELAAYIEKYLSRKSLDIDFIEFGREYLLSIPKKSTRDTLTTGFNSLCYYLKFTTGDTKLPIKSFTSKFLIKYEAWLRTDRIITVKGKPRKSPAMKESGIVNYMVTLQTIFNQAKKTFNDYEFDDIIIKGDPFKAYRIPAVKRPPRRSLSKEQLLKVLTYVPPVSDRIDVLAYDLFKMSFMMAGMNAADFYNCKTYRNGRIEYCRVKTTERKVSGDAFLSIRVRSEIEPLIEKYRDKTGKRVFNFYQKYTNSADLNVALHRGFKYIKAATGVDILQFYCARHTFATMARTKCGYSVDDVAFCLTHASGHDVTEIYIEPDYTLVDRVIDSVVTYVFDRKEE